MQEKKLINIRHYIDDDESGRFFDRSAYTQMISDVEQGKIGIVVMKDMTRWGRNRRNKKARAYRRAYYKEYRVKNLEKCREYEKLKAREYRAKKELQRAT